MLLVAGGVCAALAGCGGGNVEVGTVNPIDAGEPSRAEAGSGKEPTSSSGSSGSSSGVVGGSSSGGGGSSSGSSGGGSSSSGGSAICAPDVVCGGVYQCHDNCYTEQCCYLQCYCSDSSGLSGNLECNLSC
jgi:hypothetical protein